jgi:Topoisomerase DNA binding C4 zinc finger.
MKEVDEPKVTDILCEKCGKPMIERNGRYGKYLACSGYPECKNIKSLKDKKQQKVCSYCGEPMMLIDSGSDKIYRCTNESCGHTEDYTEKGNE